ncbi:hypothetical protein JCGZ_06582 [Jatropha curcas]|uniref:BURP domain-containing protein n=1 Tax=Jatropha curcas TaxID=180498 RepID=A0A067LC55_JATCU|nr:BURP domain protein RD22 [Jatropha curcas]KDP46071.1 hypothetical protein JCGZ_06582 [Jatropha curcas]
MKHFHLLPVFALLCVFIRGSNAILPAELYWESMLPNTPLPNALQELLEPAEAAGNRSSFSESELQIGNIGGIRATYGVGYWSESKNFKKNETFNTTTIYFLNKDLVAGKRMNIVFTKSTNGSNFLPHEIAKIIPFSSKRLLEILKHFSIKPMSKEAEIMKQTIKECEAPGITGEDKYCAISLESLVDYVIAKFGKNIEVFTNEAKEENVKQEYTILKGIRMMGEKQIVCHKERYAYAVFYCHRIMNTNVYMIPLVGADGSKAKALVVCHLDTSAWNPKHFAFHVLHVKPGGPPVCHFLNSDTIVWVPN